MSLEDILNDHEDKELDSAYTFSDVYLKREWVWLEVGVSTVSVLTGEILYIKDFKEIKHEKQ